MPLLSLMCSNLGFQHIDIRRNRLRFDRLIFVNALQLGSDEFYALVRDPV